LEPARRRGVAGVGRRSSLILRVTLACSEHPMFSKVVVKYVFPGVGRVPGIVTTAAGHKLHKLGRLRQQCDGRCTQTDHSETTPNTCC
jgi:hypothetical protein